MAWVQMREISLPKVLKTQCQVEEELHSLIQAALFYTRICTHIRDAWGLFILQGFICHPVDRFHFTQQ